ncbi:MAG: DegT/DnrJ/EryC1/StrS family aminotransferase, partial [Candidatus Fermentibacteria bacterium]
VKSRYISQWNDRRREAANRYNELLTGLPLVLPSEDGDVRHVYHLYAMHTPERDSLRDFLSSRDVASGLHYPFPLHTQKAYSYLGYEAGDFPVSEWNSSCNLTLPMFPDLTVDQQTTVAEAVRSYFSEKD